MVFKPLRIFMRAKIVLLVEDAIIAMEMKRNLEENGYLILFITNTLKKVLDDDYDTDLLIVDLDFVPLERLSEIKDPIIFLTSQDERAVSDDTGISTLHVTYDFLYKPFSEEQLLHKTGLILESKTKNS